MGNQKPLLAFTGILIAAGAAAGIWSTLRTPGDVVPPKATTPLPVPQKPAPGPVAPSSVKLDLDQGPKVPADQLLRMPDGSMVPTLNGVKNPAKIVWGDFPYSPIVRTQKDPTVEWYVHADGTYTTTMMQWRSDLGREDPVTLCLHPAKAAPVEEAPDEGAAAPAKK